MYLCYLCARGVVMADNKKSTFMCFKKRYKKAICILDNMSEYEKKQNRLHYIYFLQNKITKEIYIGRSIYNVEYRFKQHIGSSKRMNSDVYNTPLSHSLRQFGKDSFNIGYLDCVVSHKHDFTKANDLEQKYIKEFCTLYPNGYNISGLKGKDLKLWKNKGLKK